MRLRTLPLAAGSIILGTALASSEGVLNWAVAFLSLLTALLLQVLSNLANDYGDGVSGVDGDDRQGPQRVLQAGLVSATALKRSLYLVSLLAFSCGLLLLWLAQLSLEAWLILLGTGIAAIAAAITYTVGNRPYGYLGLGDLAVFVFFGPVAVAGSYFLQTGQFEASVWIMASVAGLLCAGVLNVNNIRDIETDLAAGKCTLAARLGRQGATAYQWLLMLGAVILASAYLWSASAEAWGWCTLIIPGLLWHTYSLSGIHAGDAYNLKLKQMVILATLFELLLAVDVAI